VRPSERVRRESVPETESKRGDSFIFAIVFGTLAEQTGFA
jgi:hypothetical protein